MAKILKDKEEGVCLRRNAIKRIVNFVQTTSDNPGDFIDKHLTAISLAVGAPAKDVKDSFLSFFKEEN